MTGSPIKRRVRAELERRTRAEFPDEPERTQLDYVAAWQSSGQFLKTLAGELDVSPAYLNEYLRLTFGASTVRETLTRAREEAAHVLAEDAALKADEADAINVQAKRLQMQSRQWLAEKWNQREFGQRQGATVNISIGQLALAALQAPPPAAPVLTAGSAPDAIASAIVTDVEILSVEPATDYNGE